MVEKLTEKQQQILEGKVCPYCGSPSEFVDSKEVYKSRSYGMIYLCRPCRAWVGVHKGSKKSLGRLANWNLRKAKKKAHSYFDRIWKDDHLTRKKAYSWLSEKLELPSEYTHIGMFSEETCGLVVEYSKQLLNDLRRLDLDFDIQSKTEYLP